MPSIRLIAAKDFTDRTGHRRTVGETFHAPPIDAAVYRYRRQATFEERRPRMAIDVAPLRIEEPVTPLPPITEPPLPERDEPRDAPEEPRDRDEPAEQPPVTGDESDKPRRRYRRRDMLAED